MLIRGRDRGKGRTNPSRGEPDRAPIVRSQYLSDEPIDEPLSDEPGGDGLNISSSHALDEDTIDGGTPFTDGGRESTVERRFCGESRAPRPPENLDQRIPAIIHWNTRSCQKNKKKSVNRRMSLARILYQAKFMPTNQGRRYDPMKKLHQENQTKVPMRQSCNQLNCQTKRLLRYNLMKKLCQKTQTKEPMRHSRNQLNCLIKRLPRWN